MLRVARRGLLAAFFVTACSAAVGADPVSVDLLTEHDLEAVGATMTEPIEIGDPEEAPWAFYAEASRAIGLGAGWARGEIAELRTTPVRGSVDGVRAHVLLSDGRIIGAWLSHPDAAPGIYSLDSPP